MVDKESYTHGYHESVLASHRWRTAENSAGYLLAHLTAGMDLLDVGSGPGTITMDLARLVAPGRCVGIDTSDQLVAGAAQRAGTELASLSFEVGDAYALPAPDQSFDVVHAHQVLQHLADPVAALVEMRRVCRHGGLVAVREADYAQMSWYPEVPELEAWRALYRAVARANRGEPDAGRYLLAWAHAAGLAEATVSASVWCFATPVDRQFWGGTWAERIVASKLATDAVALGLASATDLAEMAAGFLAWAANPDAVFTVVHDEMLWRAGAPARARTGAGSAPIEPA